MQISLNFIIILCLLQEDALDSFKNATVITDFKCEGCVRGNTSDKIKNGDDEEEKEIIYTLVKKEFVGLPKVLILHLLRFFQSKSNVQFKVNDRFVVNYIESRRIKISVCCKKSD